MNYNKIAKKLSTDKPFDKIKSKNPFIDKGLKYIIYANGTRWVFNCWVQWSLYWIPKDVKIDELSDHIRSYECTWLTPNQHIKNIESIIWKHPNLTHWNWRWLPTSIIKFLWKIGFRFTSY